MTDSTKVVDPAKAEADKVAAEVARLMAQEAEIRKIVEAEEAARLAREEEDAKASEALRITHLVDARMRQEAAALPAKVAAAKAATAAAAVTPAVETTSDEAAEEKAEPTA
jgi:hypothetical protein